uniref:uncharacterized protein LOC120346643 isoform X1 n=2 Tax=Styela clava TaxID=7725 RepID=UPI001939E8BB|nr:uncharacterized protein LOC120346643 isoform X1 [Styela clava]
MVKAIDNAARILVGKFVPSKAMPDKKSGKRATKTPKISSPVHHWLAHLKHSTSSESHNLLQHSGLMKNRTKYSIVHIVRNLPKVLIIGNKNYTKFATRLNSMLLFSNGADVYTHLLRMQKLVLQCHDHFVEYMKPYISHNILNRLQDMSSFIQGTIDDIDSSSDYVDTRTQRIVSDDANLILKKHYSDVENIKRLFEMMVTEIYKVIIQFMENCTSDLLKDTIMREILRHLAVASQGEFVATCLKQANAVPLFLKNPKEIFFRGLLIICRLDYDLSISMSSNADQLCRVVDDTKDEEARSLALEILSMIVSRASKILNVEKSNGKIGVHDMKPKIDKLLSDKLSAIASLATRQLFRVSSINSTQVYHSTLKIICGIWRISNKQTNGTNGIHQILSKTVEPLIARLDDLEEKDAKTRHLTLIVIAMLARHRVSQEKLAKKFVIQRILQIMEDVNYKRTNFNNKQPYSSSGYVSSTDTTCSTSCESLVKPFASKRKKQVTFASDCTLASTLLRPDEVAPSINNEIKGSLPDLINPTINIPSSLKNRECDALQRKTVSESDTQYDRFILHNCAIALVRICLNHNSSYFLDSGGIEVITKILKTEDLGESILPYLVCLRDIGNNKEDITSQDGSTMDDDISRSGSIID